MHTRLQALQRTEWIRGLELDGAILIMEFGYGQVYLRLYLLNIEITCFLRRYFWVADAVGAVALRRHILQDGLQCARFLYLLTYDWLFWFGAVVCFLAYFWAYVCWFLTGWVTILCVVYFFQVLLGHLVYESLERVHTLSILLICLLHLLLGMGEASASGLPQLFVVLLRLSFFGQTQSTPIRVFKHLLLTFQFVFLLLHQLNLKLC